MKTRSQPGSICAYRRRRISRIRRFARLRTTAPPTRLPTVMPILVASSGRAARAATITSAGSARERPCRRTRPKSAGERKRHSRRIVRRSSICSLASCRPARLLLVSDDREHLASMRPTALEDAASARRRHSATEAVRLDSLPLLGLPCALHLKELPDTRPSRGIQYPLSDRWFALEMGPSLCCSEPGHSCPA